MLCIAYLCSWGLFAGPAHALVVIPDSVEFDYEDYPSGGVITGQAYCVDACVEGQVVFQNDRGEQVSGTLISQGERDFAWLAESPLEPGTYYAYTIDRLLPDQLLSKSIQILPPSDELPIVEASLSIQTFLKSSYGNPVYCEEVSSTAELKYSPGFYEYKHYKGRLNTELTGLNRSQFEHYVVLDGESLPADQMSVEYALNAAPDQLCFEAFGKSLLSEEEVSLGRQCLSTEEFTFGVVEKLEWDYLDTLRLCSIPPEEYRQDWCDAFAEAFVRKSCTDFDEAACMSARSSCAEGDVFLSSETNLSTCSSVPYSPKPNSSYWFFFVALLFARAARRTPSACSESSP